MKTVIYLTRHGQTVWNKERRLQGRADSPLTEEGLACAKALANRVETLALDCVVTSPIQRAYQTAEQLSGQCPLIVHEGLIEMSFGAYEGKVAQTLDVPEEVWSLQAVMAGNTTMRAPGGETLQEVRERVRCAMDELIETYKGQTLLVVAHGITLKAIMYYFGDTDAVRDVMGQATLTKVIVDEAGKATIVFKNDSSHFANPSAQKGW